MDLGYRCDYCQAAVDPKSPGVYRRAVGWVKNSKGTPTGLVMPEAAVGWACATCIDYRRLKRSSGPGAGQGDLFQ